MQEPVRHRICKRGRWNKGNWEREGEREGYKGYYKASVSECGLKGPLLALALTWLGSTLPTASKGSAPEGTFAVPETPVSASQKPPSITSATPVSSSKLARKNSLLSLKEDTPSYVEFISVDRSHITVTVVMQVLNLQRVSLTVNQLSTANSGVNEGAKLSEFSFSRMILGAKKLSLIGYCVANVENGRSCIQRGGTLCKGG
jgi:hypothetical protein